MGRMENGLYFMRRIPESFAGKCNWKMIKLVKRLRMLDNVICVRVLWNSLACRFVYLFRKLSYILSLSYSL